MSQGVYSTGPAAGSGTEETTVNGRGRRIRWSGAVRFLRGMRKEGRKGAEKWEEVLGMAAASNDMANGKASGREEAVAAPAPIRKSGTEAQSEATPRHLFSGEGKWQPFQGI